MTDTTDFSVQCPTKYPSDCAEGEYYDDLVTQFGSRLSPPRTVSDVQHAIEALDALGVQGPQGPEGAQGPQGPQGAQGDLGPTGVSGSQGTIAFNNEGFTDIPGYPSVTIPSGASGGVFYIEANHSARSPQLTGETVFFESVISHSVSGTILHTQKPVATGIEGGSTDPQQIITEFNVHLSTITQLPAGTLTVQGNTGGDDWEIKQPTIHFFQIS